MANQDYTQLRGVDELGDDLIGSQLANNLINFYNWGMLGVGGFFNINITTTGPYGGNQHQLRPVQDPNYADGQVWEGFRSDWVWETGVNYNTQPIRVSGVFVDGAFQPATGVGTYAHHINYPLGRVVFDTAVSTTSTLTAEFSYRWAHFDKADSPWMREVMYRSNRVDDAHFLQMGSGNWSAIVTGKLSS